MVTITKGYTKNNFELLRAVNDASYSGEERPTREQFQHMLDVSEVWVAREQDMIVGFMIVSEMGMTPYLWSLAVLPEHRGQGVGGRLLAFALQAYPEIELHCRADNSVQKMYFDQGFRVVGFIPTGGYYPDGPALKMRRA